ncbi:MAG: YraN family protein [Burkholderiaceae bacterium]|nr:YraN family protein [Burkholderiaceae bacterium]
MPDDNSAYQLAHQAQRLAVRKRHRRTLTQSRRAARQPTNTHELKYSPTQRAGQAAETLAAQELTQAGLLLLAQNLRCKAGEIDLIAMDGATLVFIEVRKRQSLHYGGAAASVNRRKQQRLIRAAQYFLPLLTRRYFAGLTPPCRFDVISIEPNGINWIKQAFCVT